MTRYCTYSRRSGQPGKRPHRTENVIAVQDRSGLRQSRYHRHPPDSPERWHPISLPLSACAAPLSDQCIAWQPKSPDPQIQIPPRSHLHSVQNSPQRLPSVRRFSLQKQPRVGYAAAWCKCGVPYTDDPHSRSSSLSLPFTPAGLPPSHRNLRLTDCL